MFFVDVETADGAATCAALMAHDYKPCQISRLIKDGKTTTRVAFPSSATKAAEQLKESPEFVGAAYAFHIVQEARALVPHVYTELPNGKALILSADLPKDKICEMFKKAMTV